MGDTGFGAPCSGMRAQSIARLGFTSSLIGGTGFHNFPERCRGAVYVRYDRESGRRRRSHGRRIPRARSTARFTCCPQSDVFHSAWHGWHVIRDKWSLVTWPLQNSSARLREKRMRAKELIETLCMKLQTSYKMELKKALYVSVDALELVT